MLESSIGLENDITWVCQYEGPPAESTPVPDPKEDSDSDFTTDGEESSQDSLYFPDRSSRKGNQEDSLSEAC